MGSRGVKRIDDVRLLRAHQFAEDSGPMAHPVRPQSYIEINNFYTVTVYEKGAEVVRMQANLLGPERFRAATDLYFARHDGQAVTTDDFVQCMADASGRELTQFKHWYDYAGTPELAIEGLHDPAARRYTLTVRQRVPATPGQAEKPPFHIPLAVGLLGTAGEDLPLRLAGETAAVAGTRMLEVRAAEERFVFEDVEAPPVPSLLRGFSAPVKVRFAYSDEELMFLMAHDSDGFNRWDAAQTLAQRLILGLVEAGPGEVELPAGFLDAFARVLRDPQGDPALQAEILSLPSESYLGDQMAVVDVDGIHRVRRAVRAAIGRALGEDLARGYAALEPQGPYRPEPAEIGRRRLRNLLLGYLVDAGGGEAAGLCLAQYHARHNMTDVMAALALIADGALPERDRILEDFAGRWHGDPLVMDKWFGVQAVSSREDTLARVKALLEHPQFSLRNPNKVRALIGSFAAGNPVRFHAPDGSGYAFLAERILDLDPLNPQVAARLVRVMARWRRFDAGRQALLREQLERLAGAPGVSKDVYEIASKSLQ
jgi:aminopeptidase N